MKIPVFNIGPGYCEAHSANLSARADTKEFHAVFRGEEIRVPVEKLGKDTKDPWVNLTAGIVWIIELKLK